MMPLRIEVLEEAQHLITNDRNEDYGDPGSNFQCIADMWTAYLDHKIEPHDVAALMILVKLSRVQSSPGKRNNTLFAIGTKMKLAQVPNWGQLVHDRALEVGLDIEEADKLLNNIIKYGGA